MKAKTIRNAEARRNNGKERPTAQTPQEYPTVLQKQLASTQKSNAENIKKR